MDYSQIIFSSYNTFKKYIHDVYSARLTGKLVTPLSTGYPFGREFRLSKTILQALNPSKKGEEVQRYGYGWNFNYHELKSAIASYENTKNNAQYNTDNIALTAGGSYGINKVIQLLREEDAIEEILVVGPTFYRLFGEISKYIKINSVIGLPENNFLATTEQISKALTKKTKVIFLCNPSNPGYKMFPKKSINKLIQITQKKKLTLIIDEVGDAFRYHNAINYRYPKRINIKNVIRICSASKVFMLAEYRMGYVIGHETFIKKLSILIGDDMSHIPLGPSDAWLIGLKEESNRLRGCSSSDYKNIYKANINLLSENIKTVKKAFTKHKNIRKVWIPDTCFSLIFKMETNKYKNDIEICKALLNHKGVSIVPGSAFGIDENLKCFRLTFAVSPNVLIDGLNRILEFLEE